MILHFTTSKLLSILVIVVIVIVSGCLVDSDKLQEVRINTILLILLKGTLAINEVCGHL